MNDGDKNQFGIRIMVTAEMLGRELSEPAIVGYWRALADLTLKQVCDALDVIERDGVWPTPAMIRRVADHGGAALVTDKFGRSDLKDANTRARSGGYNDYRAMLGAHEQVFECPPGSNRCHICQREMEQHGDSPSLAVARLMRASGV